MSALKYSGSSLFRQRIVAAILANRPLKIDKIRSDDEEFPGLQDFEANFLRLIEAITDGTKIEINETGTTLRFKPGIIIGGKITHDCGVSRSMGWFIEGILPLAPFCKFPLHLTLTGITHDELDISIDILNNVTLPILQNFGIYGATLKAKKRGMPPKGGGMLELSIPPVRASLQPIYLIDEGVVKRIRGTAFCTRISPTIITRVIESCRGVLNDFLPDVRINADHYKGGKDGGDSPGYSLSLIAETTTGALLSIERTAKVRRQKGIPGAIEATQEVEREAPEDIGTQGAHMLIEEIFSGGVIDRTHQPLILQLMVLTQEDVSKVRFGTLTPQAVEMMRLIKDAFGTIFRVQTENVQLPKIKREKDESMKEGSDNEEEEDDDNDSEGDNDSAMDEDNEADNSNDDEDDQEDEEDNENEEDDEESANDQEEDEDNMIVDGSTTNEEDEGPASRTSYLVSCLGTGYMNVNRKVT